MRVGAGLDNGNRLRRGPLDTWKYIYTENADALAVPAHTPGWVNDAAAAHPLRKTGSQLLNARAQPKMRAAPPAGADCDAERPRIFHMYWSGPFTDKPYMTLLSFLYTQPLGLHAAAGAAPACAPQFWVWINPGAGGSVPNPGATRAMFDGLAANPWAAPFLHARFHAAVKFKLWNTTAQLDAHAELAGWRAHSVLGKLVPDPTALAALRDAAAGGGAAGEAALVQLRASDKAQVIMSDLVRFVVTHAYGGAYVDVDHVLLRDWEELWGWRGAFAMRWSHHPAYNTAVLRMHAGSPLGAFFLRTALASARREPFHPFDISDYLDDAALAPLLVRIPDALFDPNFLNMEGLQRERPPFPAYSWTSGFEEFFATPARAGAEGGAAGFDAFFRGAFAYHWHNKWCVLRVLFPGSPS
jgi:WD repeat and SOF domain-containing protein 1